MTQRLRTAGCVFAEDEAALLRSEAGDPDQLEQLARRRIDGEPLEQVLGWAEFAGLRLAVAPGVFVPRRRSALLVGQAADRCSPGDLVIELCCGVGAIGAALLQRVTGLELYATDIDPVAVACTRRNLGPQATALVGDLFTPLPSKLIGRAAIVVANAPYVPTEDIALMPTEARDHEARAALDGGPDGLVVHRRIIAEAERWLRPGGSVLLETSKAQSGTDLDLFRAAGFDASVVTDDSIAGTVVRGVSRGRPGHPSAPAFRSPTAGGPGQR